MERFYVQPPTGSRSSSVVRAWTRAVNQRILGAEAGQQPDANVAVNCARSNGPNTRPSELTRVNIRYGSFQSLPAPSPERPLFCICWRERSIGNRPKRAGGLGRA